MDIELTYSVNRIAEAREAVESEIYMNGIFNRGALLMDAVRELVRAVRENEMRKALMVFILDDDTRMLLMRNDPQALKQAARAVQL